jgi:hypothetical protein
VLTNRIRATLVVLAASAGLAGCTTMGPYGGIGVGVGSQYGYGNQGYGYGGYGYDPYYAGYGYGSGYGYNPYGWYNGYYYPGSGYWVYDRDRTRRTMTPEERAYWLERLSRYRGFTVPGVNNTGTTATTTAPTSQQPRENWSGFNRRGADTAAGTGTPTSRETLRQRVLEQRAQRAQASSERSQARAERSEARQQQVQERREARPARRPRD